MLEVVHISKVYNGVPAVANTHYTAHYFLAHLLAISVGGIFTATGCLSLLSLTVLLPSPIRRIASPLLQAMLIALLLLFLFFSPAISMSLQPLVASRSHLTELAPPFWFTGIYEYVLHPDTLGQLFSYLVARGVMATLLSAAALLPLYPLAHSRTAARLLEGDGVTPLRQVRSTARFAGWLDWYAPLPTQRAAFHLLGITLLRVQRLRACAIFATCAGFALAITAMGRPRILDRWPFVHMASRFPVAITFLFLFIALGSLRLLLSSNIEPKTGWLFECTVGRADSGLASGVRRWMFCAAFLAGALVLLALWRLLPQMAGDPFSVLVRTLLTLFAACVLLVEMLFHSFREIPFCSHGLRRRTLPAIVLANIFVLLPVSLIALRRIEPAASTRWLPVIFFLACAVLAHTTLSRRRERPTADPPVEDAEDEYFQRLGI